MLSSADIAALPGVQGLFEFSIVSTSEHSDDIGKMPTISLVASCEDLSHFGEITGDCAGADVVRLREWDEATYAIERVEESIELGHVDTFVDFEARSEERRVGK